MQETPFCWLNPHLAHLTAGLAVGSFGGSNGMNLLVPGDEADFANIRFGIRFIAIHRSEMQLTP